MYTHWFWWLLVGQCSDGDMLVLSRHSGCEGEDRYYDSETGVFIAVATSSDAIDPICGGRRYWPRRVVCRDFERTEIICDAGDQFE